MDIVPNVAPNVLAEYVSACMPNMVRSLEICKNQLLSEGTLVLSGDSVNVTDRRNYSTPEEFEEFFRVRTDARGGQRCPVEFDQNGETCVDMEELLVPPEMLPHLHRCQRVQELSSSCPLKYVGFAQMYELQRLDRCGSCKCMCDVDPVCSATCSAKDVYLDQMT